MDYSQDPQAQTMIDNLPEKTGKSLPEWFKVLSAASFEKHGQMVKYLKSEFGVTHGFANTIVLLYRQKLAGGPQEGEDLIAKQYEKKPELKTLYDKLIKDVRQFGDDVELAPKKSYVSLRRSKQFAIIQPSTKTHIDLGLNLKDVRASGPLIEGDKWSGMCSHRIELSSADDITREVLDWLWEAYQQA